MRTPVSWLAEHVDLPVGLTARQLGDALLRIGIEVERIESGADAMSGPIVVGRVRSLAEEPQKNGKTIRWCQVDVGAPEPRGIVCGAANFAEGDLVVVSLPGAVLPGPFPITARKTCGHVSDGMICSARELGIGDEHAGILVLAPGSALPGEDGPAALGLRDAVLDVAVTTDRGYCLSIRGLAREASAALGTAFHDVAVPIPEVDGGAYEVRIADPIGCDRFSARTITGLDPTAPTPVWMARRLRQSGVRAISLTVDVTNYVMLESGQPLHAYDLAKLSGPIVVRRAAAGETLSTLDGALRRLDPGDLLVTDGSGPIGLGGVMGGASTEIGAATTAVVLEAAHWEPTSIARTARRHRLGSEASRRFERGVDPEIAGVALVRCVDLLVEHGGARAVHGYTVVGAGRVPAPIALAAGLPASVAGMPISRADVIAHLEIVGCAVEKKPRSERGPDAADVLLVQPPTWRPDLLGTADLVEEVMRLAGYDKLPSVLPAAPPGRGLTARQRLQRGITRAVSAAGLTEVLCYPFVAPSVHDAFGLAPDDIRRRALRLANPLSDTEPELRTSLLPGLLAALVRNVGRGSRDLALFETGLVFLPGPQAGTPAPLGVDRRPSAAEIGALDAMLPVQPSHLAAVLCGDVERRGWWGRERTASWVDAVAVAQVVARLARCDITTRPAANPPWHPGRCAALLRGEQVVGYAGELHPGVVAALGLPERTCAMEMNLDLVPAPAPPIAPVLSTYPPVLLDVALVIGTDVAAADVLATLREGAGPLLETARLFDLYADEQRLGAGLRSLAFALRFRAPDRTLTVEEAVVGRDAAIAAAVKRHGARLRA